MAVSAPKTGSLRATLRHPELWAGLASSLLIAFTALTVRLAALFGLPAPLMAARDAIKGQIEEVLVVAGVAGLIAAWLALRPRPDGRPAPSWGFVAVVWSLPLVFALPSFTDDAWAYLDQGWQLMRGINPYIVGLTDAGGPFAPLVDGSWAHTTTAYPPLALRFNQFVVLLAGPDPLRAVVVLRLFSVAALFVVALDSHVAVGPRLAMCTSIALAGYSVVSGESVFGSTPSLLFFVVVLVLLMRFAPRLAELAPDPPQRARPATSIQTGEAT
jgi:hypothetical protein